MEQRATNMKNVLEGYIGKQIILMSANKSLALPHTPLTLNSLQEDYFLALSNKGVPFYVAYNAISVMSSITGAEVLQIQLM